jgi:hypothetical protein
MDIAIRNSVPVDSEVVNTAIDGNPSKKPERIRNLEQIERFVFK